MCLADDVERGGKRNGSRSALAVGPELYAKPFTETSAESANYNHGTKRREPRFPAPERI